MRVEKCVEHKSELEAAVGNTHAAGGMITCLKFGDCGKRLRDQRLSHVATYASHSVNLWSH